MESNMDKFFDAGSKTQLLNDFNMVVKDTEDLIKATANQGGEKVAELREKVGVSIKLVKANLDNLESVMLHKTKAAAKATNEYVHENPWQSITVFAGLGLLVGWLAARR
jgi:ElaB/YqjD/DUF883 family membrane-anchored ribosome-binding protein